MTVTEMPSQSNRVRLQWLPTRLSKRKHLEAARYRGRDTRPDPDIGCSACSISTFPGRRPIAGRLQAQAELPE